MPEPRYVWFNGELVRWEEAKIHVATHALHYGTGVFEGIRAYKTVKGVPAIFRLKEHIERFFNSAKLYRFEIPFSAEEIAEACKLVVKENGLDDAYIRPLAYLKVTEIGVKPKSREAGVVVFAIRWGRYLGEAYEKGANCLVSVWRRLPPFSFPTVAKACGHYINSYLAAIDAMEGGYDEAIMLDHRGFVSEGTGENIFMVKGGKVYTTPLEASILPGITRDTVIKLCRDLGLEVVEKDITLGELLTADEAFFTGTAAEVTPIARINGIAVGDGKPGPVTRKLQQLYSDVVRGKVRKYEGWLTYVE
ncbi:TPA: branched-chain amino acid transaminase [Candidatus Micrarchaeota archaeon]|nr:branched-chain amino acid transaminase [Candidatus Micrarchaeota archaeon]